MNEHLQELLPFYALDVLTDEEKEGVERYLASNSEAQAELVETKAAISLLAYSAEPIKPPPKLKKNLMSRVEADRQAQRHVRENGHPNNESGNAFTRLWSNLAGGSALSALAVASLLIAILAGVWAFNLQQEMAQLRSELAAIDQVLDNQVEPLTAENQILQDDLLTLQRRVAQLQQQNEALNSQLAGQTQEIAAVNNAELTEISGNQALPSEIADLQTQLSTQDEALTAITSILSTLEDNIVPALNDDLNQLKQANADIRNELSAQRAAMAQLTTPGVQVMLISGTEALPNAHGHLVANPEGESAMLIVAGLQQLQPGLEYHFWLVENGAPVRVGALDVDNEGLGLLLFSSRDQIRDFEAMGISIEPAGSSGKPTNKMILTGQFSS